MKLHYDPSYESLTDALITNFTSNYHCCEHTWIKLDDIVVTARRYPHPIYRVVIITSEYLRAYDLIRAGCEKLRPNHIAIMIDVFSSRCLR